MKKILVALALAAGILVAAQAVTAGGDRIPHLSGSEFMAVTGQVEKPVLIQFDAEWCPFCRALQPDLEKLARKKKGELDVFRLDTDAEPELTLQYNIKSLPTLIIFQGGEELARHDGAPKGEDLVEWVDATIGK
jgi:thioredoxin